MNRWHLLPLALAMASALAGCSHNPLDGLSTLADLPEPTIPVGEQIIEPQDLAQIEANYRAALQMATNPEMRHHIQVRLADLEMARSEAAQQQARTLTAFFSEPIADYRALVDAYRANPAASVASQPDALYYKLSKAYALDGRDAEAAATLDELAQRFPESPYIHETQFRRAERAFAAGNYLHAEQLYHQVAVSETSAFADNSLYMEGWSAYKQSQYDVAVVRFTELLDKKLAQARLSGEVAGVIEQMGAADRNLIQDTLRVLSFTYANLDGPQTIAEQQASIGTRPYQFLLYQQLGELYLTQQRYLDSADTFARFVNHNPDSDMAPDFSIREIEVYQAGGFPSLVLPAKRAYATRYGIYSHYWQARADLNTPPTAMQAKQVVRTQKPRNMSANALDKLRLYLEQLARHHHSEAQRLEGLLAEGGATAPSRADINRSFSEAADLYLELVLTFPADNAVAEMTFLMAEALNEGQRTIDALAAYENVAFAKQDAKYGAEAGYSAVLLASELVQRSESGELLEPSALATQAVQSSVWQWQWRKIDTSIKFAELYPADPRAITVLTQTAPELLYQGDLVRAAEIAQQVIVWQPTASGDLLYTAWLTLGHAQFEQELYLEAETAYWRALDLHPQYGQQPGSPSARELRERIAASLYQQAQTQLIAGNSNAAIDLLLRIYTELPGSNIASQALFDAGHAAQMAADWGRAESLLNEFAVNYPSHELNARLPAKLIVIYEAMGNWGAAADLLSAQANSSQDPEQARQSLITAAEYYVKADNWEAARDHYRQYAHSYPLPVAELLEVEQRLVELYSEKGDINSRNFWLARVINSARKAPSDRSHYLAASAATTLAEAPYQRFSQLRLTLPIKNSLAKKRDALDKALKAQQRVLDFKVADFTTRANFYIGEIYLQLAQDLMDSERPDNLNMLELEQYDILLEEQAYPFEEKAIELHEANAQRAWGGLYDDWVKASLKSLAGILSARYNKNEFTIEAADEIR
ncbi:tetratricopeptide repeat protein [Gilvimarinus polysaccharolyticus]|uniref:tetratricopeptide repeat protein n=1 Tax=Gilvimarinus polysaccharolyticus TaxID=863921 RepID=UPI0006738BCC|nr:tetratricopeptide repeat protein [Gilvimarinus polysaccharolyticus]